MENTAKQAHLGTIHALSGSKDKTEPPTPNERQTAILEHLAALGNALTTCQDVADAVGMTNAEAARKAIGRMCSGKMLTTQPVRGRAQGFRVLAIHVPVRTPVRTTVRTLPQPVKPSGRPSGRLPNSQIQENQKLTSDRPDARPDASPPPTLEERKKDSYLSFQEAVRSMRPDAYRERWPNLHKVGLTHAKALDLISKKQMLGESMDLLAEGMDNADTAVELGLEKMAKGNVRSPLAYVFGPLLRSGYFDRHPDHKTAEERAAEDAERKLTALQDAVERQKKAAFAAWCFTVPKNEKRALQAKWRGPRHDPDFALRMEWKERGEPDPLNSVPKPVQVP